MDIDEAWANFNNIIISQMAGCSNSALSSQIMLQQTA